jgi:iron only hydrogenase large subunit-like protein/two-component sensor histidine kinase
VKINGDMKLVFSLKDRCKVCYTCVRECPAKAIRISNGQAEVIPERCIACGNCVKVCSQGAKVYIDSRERVMELVKSGSKTALLLAPSFPAEFKEYDDYRVVVGMMRKLGFDYVIENAIGADVIAKVYEDMINHDFEDPHISSDCPAIVNYISRYHPELMHYVPPIGSPMVVSARISRLEYGDDLKIVFAGPCIAKKAESEEVDEVLTFIELRELLAMNEISPLNSELSDFDPPHPGKGSIFPVSRGMLQTVNKTEDICEGNVIVAAGKVNFKDALKEFEAGLLNTNHLELLCCEGCIMGPGMTKGGKKYSRRKLISNYVQDKLNRLDRESWENNIEKYCNLDLRHEFKAQPLRTTGPTPDQIEEVLARFGKTSPTDHLNCGACGYETCVEHAIAVAEGIAEIEMCLPYTIDHLHQSVEDLNRSNEKLANAQQALKQSEKLAHMGQLSAGIAHELNNPLGVITMYSNILKDELSDKDPIREDLQLIADQANRCKNIVGNLLNFARRNHSRPVPTDLNDLILRSIHSVIRPGNIDIRYESGIKDPVVELDPDQIMQVLTNLEKNAVDAMPNGGNLIISTTESPGNVEIIIQDNGQGIPEDNLDKLFTPFFTTKKIGQGTGLGLALVYSLVKIHKGQIIVKSNADPAKGLTGTTFNITLPRNSKFKKQTNE